MWPFIIVIYVNVGTIFRVYYHVYSAYKAVFFCKYIDEFDNLYMIGDFKIKNMWFCVNLCIVIFKLAILFCVLTFLYIMYILCILEIVPCLYIFGPVVYNSSNTELYLLMWYLLIFDLWFGLCLYAISSKTKGDA